MLITPGLCSYDFFCDLRRHGFALTEFTSSEQNNRIELDEWISNVINKISDTH